MPKEVRDQLAAYIEARVVIEPNCGCWIWMMSDRGSGYPQGSFPAATGQRVSYAHRLSYIAKHGQIPDGFDVDHLCKNRICVNPDHLEAVTPHANRSRAFGIKAHAKTSKETGCPKGHGDYVEVGGKLICRQCHNDRNQRYREKRRAAWVT